MSNRDDLPGSTGYPDDDINAPTSPPPGRPSAVGGVRSTQALGVRDYDFDDGDEPATALVGTDTGDAFADTRQPARGVAKNPATDLGLLIVRLVIGVVFVLHGAQKLFGVLDGPGVDGFAQALTKMGFEQGSLLAVVTGATELGAGALLVLGLFTPLAAAGIVGVMANAVAMVHGSGFLGSDGFEYPLVLGVCALGLMFAGPGRASLDNGRAWFLRPITSGFVCLIIAGLASAGVLVFLHH